MSAILNPKWSPRIQKSSDLGEIWFPNRFCSCKLISVIVFGIGSHFMILQIISYLVIIILPTLLLAAILSDQILRDRWSDLYWTSQEGGSPSQEVHSGLGIFKMAADAMETVNICQNLWPQLYRKLPKGFPQDLAYILSRVGRIFWPNKIASEWPATKSSKFQCSLISMKINI